MSFFQSILDFITVKDDGEFSDEKYDEYVEANSEEEAEEEEEIKETKQPKRLFWKNKKDDDTEENEMEEEAEKPLRINTGMNDFRKERAAKAERQQAKVVPIRSSANSKLMGISVMKPTSYESTKDICDVMLAGKAVIINMEGFNIDLAQRVMDFVYGAVYAVDGNVYQVSDFIFIVTPQGVEITGDYKEFFKQNGFEIPTLNKN